MMWFFLTESTPVETGKLDTVSHFFGLASRGCLVTKTEGVAQ